MTAAIIPYRNREALLRQIYARRNERVIDHMGELLAAALDLELASDPALKGMNEDQANRIKETW